MSLLTNTVATVASGQALSTNSLSTQTLHMDGSLTFQLKTVLMGNNAGIGSNLGEGNILIGANARVDPLVENCENSIALGNNCVVPASNTIAIARDPSDGKEYVSLILGWSQGGYYSSPSNIIPGPFYSDQEAADAGVPLGGLFYNYYEPSWLCIRLT